MAMIYLFISFIISFLTCIAMIYLHNKKGFFNDNHQSNKPQKFHIHSTSRSGGIGIFLSSLVLIMYSKLTLSFILAGFFAFLSGIIEDFNNSLSPKLRLLIQSLAAVLGILLYNAWIWNLNIGFELPLLLGAIFSIFAVVGCINAINIIDGFNGLASGISILILSSLLIASHMVQDTQITWLCASLIFAIFGFFVLNFPKGKIFLGDGGAYFLGFCIAEISILLTQKHDEISSWFALSIMAYPVYEVLFSAYRKKILKNMSPLEPDSLHLHMLVHKRITKNNAKTSLLLILLNLPFIFLPLLYKNNTKAQILSFLIFIICYHTLYRKLVFFKIKK